MISALYLIGTCCLILFDYFDETPRNLYLLFCAYITYTGGYLCLFFKNGGESQKLRLYFWLGILCRVALLFVPVFLTTDIARYIWEGHVIRNGFSPYLYAPNSSELFQLRNETWNQVDYKDMVAVYPFAMQVLFALFAWSYFTWKIFLFSVEILTYFLLTKIIKISVKPAMLVNIYWLLPLPIIEVAYSGHLEAVVVFFIVLLWYLFKAKSQPRKPPAYVLQILVLAIASVIKYNCLFLAPLFVYEWFKKDGLKIALVRSLGLVTLLFVVQITLLYWHNFDPIVFSSLDTYLKHWRFNDSLFHLVGWLFGVSWQDRASFKWIQYLFVFVWLGIVFIATLKKISFERQAILIFGSYLFLSPVVHPWYLLWLAPFFTVESNKIFLLFCLLVPLSYSTFFFGQEQVPLLLKLIEYIPVYLILIVELFRAMKIKALRSVF